jgi:hypothetical protein
LLAENYFDSKPIVLLETCHTILQNLLVTTFEWVCTRLKPVIVACFENYRVNYSTLKKIVILPGLTRVDIFGGVHVQLPPRHKFNIHVEEGGGG